jgi:hypothetical protein
MNAVEALSSAMMVGMGRKKPDGWIDRTEEIGWLYGITGIVVLVAVQVGLIMVPFGGASLDSEIVRDLMIVAFAGLAVPFILFVIAAIATGTTNRLPAAFLYLGIVLAILQVVSGLLASFSSVSTFMLGVLGVVVGYAARGFLKVGTAGALVIGILVVAGFVAAGFLLMALPTGRLFR